MEYKPLRKIERMKMEHDEKTSKTTRKSYYRHVLPGPSPTSPFSDLYASG